jgi:hypothetical protein
MTEIPGCGTGGWTLVMKMDGNKVKIIQVNLVPRAIVEWMALGTRLHPSCKLILRTIDSDKLIIIYRINKQFHLQNEFNYSSPYWTNKETYAVEDGLEGLSEKQTKLASYLSTPFNKICLGMKVNGATKWILIDHQASSLFNVIAGGNFIATTVEKNAWKSLVKDSYLQNNCNQQGFNIVTKNKFYQYKFAYNVRIGIVANNENDCESCDSCIGFGTSVHAVI